jgi:hypothetical protein
MIIRIMGIGTKISMKYFAAYYSTLNMKAVAFSKALLPCTRLYGTTANKTVFLMISYFKAFRKEALCCAMRTQHPKFYGGEGCLIGQPVIMFS